MKCKLRSRLIFDFCDKKNLIGKTNSTKTVPDYAIKYIIFTRFTGQKGKIIVLNIGHDKKNHLKVVLNTFICVQCSPMKSLHSAW